MYQNDPDRLPDSSFLPGSLGFLIAGNSGRLLDPRRTPIAVVDVMPEKGMFLLEVTAFEDSGARWELPIEDVTKFQFALDSKTAPPAEIAQLEAAADEFHEQLTIDVDTGAGALTAARLEEASLAATGWLRRHSRFFAHTTALDTARLEGPSDLRSDLARYFTSCGVNDMERAFSKTWVSNPSSGEIVKGHLIVIARLGLAPYDGLTIRDPATFSGEWSVERRSEHILTRIGFLRAVFSLAGIERVVLYRGLSFERPPEVRTTPTLLSGTFHRKVAEAWLDPDPTAFAVTMMRQPVPVERLFMTYLETEAMNSQFREGEAVLLDHPRGPLF